MRQLAGLPGAASTVAPERGARRADGSGILRSRSPSVPQAMVGHRRERHGAGAEESGAGATQRGGKHPGGDRSDT